MEVYGTEGYAITVGPDRVRARYAVEKAESDAPLTAPPLGRSATRFPKVTSQQYCAARCSLTATYHRWKQISIVMQILEAALKSAQSGKTVTLTPLPQ